MQNDYTICYESHKLKEHEQNYPTHDIELETIIHALNMWRDYLMGRNFVLNTNNISIKHLFDQPYLNARESRWLAFLSEYHFELNHIKGKEKKIVDGLSRRAHMLYEVNLIQTDLDLHDMIRMTSIVDHFYVQVLKNIQEDMLFQQQKEHKVDDTRLLWSKEGLYVTEGGDII